jgi:hypothetical protein
LWVVPLFPFPELSNIVVPDVSDISHRAAVVLVADAVAVPSADTASDTAAVPRAARHHVDPCIGFLLVGTSWDMAPSP